MLVCLYATHVFYGANSDNLARSLFLGVLAPLIAMTKEVTIKYPLSYGSDEQGNMLEAQTCYLDMEPDVKKLYFTIMGMLFYGITAIVSIAFLSCTICKALSVDLENYFIKDDFKNHVSVNLELGPTLTMWHWIGLHTKHI